MATKCQIFAVRISCRRRCARDGGFAARSANHLFSRLHGPTCSHRRRGSTINPSVQRAPTLAQSSRLRQRERWVRSAHQGHEPSPGIPRRISDFSFVVTLWRDDAPSAFNGQPRPRRSFAPFGALDRRDAYPTFAPFGALDRRDAGLGVSGAAPLSFRGGFGGVRRTLVEAGSLCRAPSHVNRPFAL